MTRRLYFEFFYYHSIPEMLLWGVLLLFFWTAAALLFHRKGWTKAWIWINRSVLIVVVGFILYWTLGKRNPSENGVSLIPFYSFVAAQTSSERYRSVVANILLFIPVGLSIPFSLCRLHLVTSGAEGQVSTGREAHLSRSQPLNDSTGQLAPVSSSPGLNDSAAQVKQGMDESRALETGSSRDLEPIISHPVITTILFAVLLSVGIELAQWKWGLGLAETDDVIMNTLGAAAGTLAFIICSCVSRTHSQKDE